MADPSTVITCPSCGTKNRVRPQPDGVPRCSVCHAPLPWIVEASADTFAREIDAAVPVLADFWAPWCGPCRAVSPLVEEAGRQHAGRLKIVKLNVDEAPAIAERYAVRGIPLLVLLKNRSEVDRVVGAVPPAQLAAFLARHLEPAGERA